MFFVLNIILIALAGLIAYWWANQGFFSALLHLLCVIVAGTLAFAFWEPFAFMMIRGNWLDAYAWGVALIVPFCVFLVILRLGLDKLCPSNVNVPRWADLSLGGAAGAGAGVITVGILVLGLSHIQSKNDIMGFRGIQRHRDTGKVAKINGLWLPFHQWTSDLYSNLSVGSMRSGTPMKAYMPDAYAQATLFRDSVSEGKGKTTMPPDGVKIKGTVQENNRYFVKVDFELPAIDYGELLTMTSAQCRLIEDTTNEAGRLTTREARVEFPVAWRQHSGYHQFDSINHALTSQAAKENARGIIFEFKLPGDFTPRFLQIKGTRYTLPAPKPDASVASIMQSDRPETVAVAGMPIDSAIFVTNDIRPINVGVNTKPAGIEHDDETKTLTTGEADFASGGKRPPRALRIGGIYEPDGSRCVQVIVSRNSAANLFGLVEQNEALGAESRLRLLDSNGVEYTSIGYMLVDGQNVRVKLDPVRRLPTFGDFPSLAAADSRELKILFRVTENETITGMMIDDVVVGSANKIVK